MPESWDTRRFKKGYSGARPDLNGMITGQPERILDVGCGAGLNLALLCKAFPDSTVVGIDPSAHPELQSAERIKFVQGKAECPESLERLEAWGPYDLIIFADVLEHLDDPWAALARYRKLLAPSGRIITSIPNVRHYSTFVRLLFTDRWPRKNRGIHDRTHRHFFARQDILDLGRSAGLSPTLEKRNVRLIEGTILSQPPARLLDFWPFRPFVTFQYLHIWQVDR